MGRAPGQGRAVIPIESLLQSPPEKFRERLVRDLVDVGYAVFPALLRPELVLEVRGEMEKLLQAGEFRPASIGKGAGTQLSPEVRGDGTYWFEAGEPTPTQSKLAEIFSMVRESLNSALFLGLWDWEGHYAIYPPGTFYRRHFDRFANDSKRTVSMVFFFNPDWTESDGGALRIEAPSGTLEVAPRAGTAVFFLSEKIPHEVLETNRDRFSFAGWFRTRP